MQLLLYICMPDCCACCSVYKLNWNAVSAFYKTPKQKHDNVICKAYVS